MRASAQNLTVNGGEDIHTIGEGNPGEVDPRIRYLGTNDLDFEVAKGLTAIMD
jgi:hypothetical protein